MARMGVVTMIYKNGNCQWTFNHPRSTSTRAGTNYIYPYQKIGRVVSRTRVFHSMMTKQTQKYEPHPECMVEGKKVSIRLYKNG
jgi:hypothetical protein